MPMREAREYLLIGGPRDGERFTVDTDQIELEGYPTMAYHRVGRDRMEWHEREWISPVVAAIRAAIERRDES